MGLQSIVIRVNKEVPADIMAARQLDTSLWECRSRQRPLVRVHYQFVPSRFKSCD